MAEATNPAAQEVVRPKKNTVRMKSDGDTASFTHGEASYDVDDKGFIELPPALVTIAKSHGFTIPGEKEAPAARVKAGS